VVAKNDIRNVDEGLDIFGSDIKVLENRIGASGRPLKLIHGASGVEVTNNILIPGVNGYVIGIYKANPPEAKRQVHDIVIERNRLDLSAAKTTGARVDADGEYPPKNITFRRNEFLVARCDQPALTCTELQCSQGDNRRFLANGGVECPH
jgi:hypothetical protein